jgi:hypothetical protein
VSRNVMPFSAVVEDGEARGLVDLEAECHGAGQMRGGARCGRRVHGVVLSWRTRCSSGVEDLERAEASHPGARLEPRGARRSRGASILSAGTPIMLSWASSTSASCGTSGRVRAVRHVREAADSNSLRPFGIAERRVRWALARLGCRGGGTSRERSAGKPRTLDRLPAREHDPSAQRASGYWRMPSRARRRKLTPNWLIPTSNGALRRCPPERRQHRTTLLTPASAAPGGRLGQRPKCRHRGSAGGRRPRLPIVVKPPPEPTSSRVLPASTRARRGGTA